MSQRQGSRALTTCQYHRKLSSVRGIPTVQVPEGSVGEKEAKHANRDWMCCCMPYKSGLVHHGPASTVVPIFWPQHIPAVWAYTSHQVVACDIWPLLDHKHTVVLHRSARLSTYAAEPIPLNLRNDTADRCGVAARSRQHKNRKASRRIAGKSTHWTKS